ncbi:MAG: hypothetical protein J0M34_01495 [Alphaproteobacteria bacterium]|nr:hypothetical protein [Alphaproteobacteria bacterium]
MTIPPIPDDNKTPDELFQQVAAYIDEVHGIIDRRDFLELKGLDDFIDYLCGRVMKLTPDEAKLYGVKLNELLADMNDLQARIEAAKLDVRAEINTLAKQAAAAKAYKPKGG